MVLILGTAVLAVGAAAAGTAAITAGILGGNQDAASNTVMDTVDITTNVLNATYSQCSSNTSGFQGVIIAGSTLIGNNINGLSLSQTITSYSACEQAGDFNNRVSNGITSNISQMAESVEKGIGPPPGASNYADLYTELTQNLASAYVQNCMFSSENNTQLLGVFDSLLVGNNINDVTFNQTIEAIAGCLQESSEVTDIENEIINTINQSATAKKKGILSILTTLFALFILFILIIGAIFLIYELVKKSKDKKASQEDSASSDDDLLTAAIGI